MEELIMLLGQITKLLEQYLPLEEEKLKAVKENKVSVVEECMRKEQALLLNMRGLEQKRARMLSEMGCEGKTLRELVSTVREKDRQSLQLACDKLEDTVQRFRSLNDESMKLIRLNLHQMERMAGAEGQLYGKGQQEEDNEHFISRLL